MNRNSTQAELERENTDKDSKPDFSPNKHTSDNDDTLESAESNRRLLDDKPTCLKNLTLGRNSLSDKELTKRTGLMTIDE